MDNTVTVGPEADSTADPVNDPMSDSTADLEVKLEADLEAHFEADSMVGAASFDAEFWNSTKPILLLNPRLPVKERSLYESAWRAASARSPASLLENSLLENSLLQNSLLKNGAVALATSGTSGVLKLVVLDRLALLASAEAVNSHLASNRDDVWLKTLPDFHVGGLSIFARAHLSGATVVETRSDERTGSPTWAAKLFVAQAFAKKATLASLVPAQIFDLVRAGLRSPPSLRAVIVGGGGLSANLYHEARCLGWPLLPSYGLTECGSTVAIAPLEPAPSITNEPATVEPLWDAKLNSRQRASAPALEFLPHIEARVVDGEGHLEIKSPALLRGYIFVHDKPNMLNEYGDIRFDDPKRDGWFKTEDRARLLPPHRQGARRVEILGRSGDFVKIGGESVDIARLEAKFEGARLVAKALPDCAILAAPDPRLGHSVWLIHETVNDPVSKQALLALIEAFNSSVSPFERIRGRTEVEHVPRSALGKLLSAEARALVARQSLTDI